MSNYPPPPPSRPANYPYPPSASPTNPNTYAQPPPAKRARLSPDARSPQQQYAPPPQQYGGYGNPYQPQQQQQQSPYGSPTTYAGSPQAFNTPQWHPQWQSQSQSTPRSVGMSPPAQTTSAGMMPPPPRPNKDDKEERNVNIDDIGDSLYGSGVSIKDEENYLLNVFQNRHQNNGNAGDSFASTANNTSFNSSTTAGGGNNNGSFNHLPTLISHSAFSGTLGTTQSQDHIDQTTQRARASASVSRNLAHQHPLSSGNQFLLTNPLRKRLMARAHEQGVSVNTSGLWQRAGQPQSHETRVLVGEGGREGLASVVVDTRPEFTASKGDAFEVVLSLVCLAVEGRLRGLVEDGYAISRARRYGDHGRVAPEWAGVAQGLGGAVEEVVVPEGMTGGNWDRVDAAAAGGEMSSTPQPMPTISFQSAIARKLREIAHSDEAAELARTNKRLARQRAQALKDAAATDDTMLDAAGTAEVAPEMLPKITKKELARKEKEAKLGREANSAANINSTIALATGGKKKRQYGWMTGGASAEPSNRFKEAGPKSGSGAVTPVGKVEGGGAVGSPGGLGGGGGGVGGGRGGADDFSAIGIPAPVKTAEWGEWREDSGVGGFNGEGRKVQGRDWVVVLERDGRVGRALQRFFTGVSVVEGV
ncbi:hypothetical protein LTR56_009649 [Elasticomyces elasticus]|nr:hypothetical protein LTR56_009649 [Elasticomyces elasticus]KAK3660149.1 hypothetical protein LTR22_008156 [Elasticomyces elasticus]KAK4923454.1 hypothetical protein LTR49_009328 [Elasticomyces elasticus]KAK5752326.1 hypothetical protein LTS12_017627 [Elasticomyces elasticus]